MNVCPVKAIERTDFGNMVIQRDTCVGTKACPMGSIQSGEVPQLKTRAGARLAQLKAPGATLTGRSIFPSYRAVASLSRCGQAANRFSCFMTAAAKAMHVDTWHSPHAAA